MIRFEDVSFSYQGERGSSGTHALREVALELRDGEMLAVVGANGSGKSTLALLANGLLLPTKGRVFVDDIDTSDSSRIEDVRVAVGLVFQQPDNQIVGTTVEEDVAFGPENLGLPRDEIRRRVDDALLAVDLADVAQREPHLLSGGQKQRLAMAGAVAMRPRHLVLDEPTSMLDAEGRREVGTIVKRLRAAGTSIVLITHDLAEALVADRVAVLGDGSVAFCGPPEALASDEALLAGAGISIPPIVRLAARLREDGFAVPATVVDAPGVASALWR